MKLVKQDIKHIDECLKLNNIKYIDIRSELIDHLVSEYEAMESYLDLGSFLSERMAWCREIAEKKQKSILRMCHKSVWKMFLEVIKNPQTWVVILLFTFFNYALSQEFSFKTIRWVSIAPLLLCVLIQLYFLASVGWKTRRANEMISFRYLVNLFIMPQLFLFGFNWVPKVLLHDFYFLAPYILVSTLLNYAAIKVFTKKRDGILEEYAFLKNYLA